MLAARMQGISPSPTIAMAAAADRLRAAGHDVISLAQGEPSFPTPANIAQAGIDAIGAGQTRYTAVEGVAALREAICGKLLRDNGLSYAPDQIIVGAGAKQVLFNAFLCTVEAGDEVIIPAPYWVSYPDIVRFAGGTPVVVSCGADVGFKLRPDALERAITARTKWVVLNSPSNPTGAVYTREELEALMVVVERHPRIHVLSDEIYEHISYVGQPCSPAAVSPGIQARTLVLNGVSKAYCMTGWRIGYGAGPRELIKAISVLQSQSTTNANSIAQVAATEALNGDQSVLARNQMAFRERRDLVVNRLANAPGLKMAVPDGAFYGFVDCTALLGAHTQAGRRLSSDEDVAAYFLEEAKVAVVPGAAFGASPYVRLSFAGSIETLEEACARLCRACVSLRSV